MKMMELIQPGQGNGSDAPIVGAVTMNNRDYRKAKAISQSTLKDMKKSALHFKDAILEPTEPTPQMELGTLVHVMGLEPEAFDSLYLIRGEAPDKNGVMSEVNFSTKEGKAWREENPLNGRIMLSRDQAKKAKAMVSSMLSSKTGQKLMGGHREKSFFWQDPETKLWCKGRPDIVHFTGGMLVDWKTCGAGMDGVGKGSVEKFLPHAVSMGYHIQAAFYLDGIGYALEQGPQDFEFVKPDSFVFAVIESKKPFAVSFYELPPELIEEGRKIYKRCLAQLKACLEADEWPGYADAIIKPAAKAYMFEANEVIDEELRGMEMDCPQDEEEEKVA